MDSSRKWESAGLIICIVLLFAAILAALYVRRKRQMAARDREVDVDRSVQVELA